MKRMKKANANSVASKSVFFLALFAFCAAGCSKQAQSPAPARAEAKAQPLTQPATQHYQLKGKVVSLDKANSSLSVDMQAIPGYMGAMTMSYPVHDAAAFAKLRAGDSIMADLVVSADGSYLQNVEVMKNSERGK